MRGFVTGRVSAVVSSVLLLLGVICAAPAAVSRTWRCDAVHRPECPT